MPGLRRALPLALLALLVAAPAYAASGGEGGPSWKLLFLQALNLGILLTILVRFAGKPLSKALADRSENIRREIESAESHLRQVEAEMADVQRRLVNIDSETEQIVSETIQAAEAERVRSAERATLAGERIRAEARRVADSEVARARQSLREEAAGLATKLAREILRERLGPDDDRRLTQEMIARIGDRS